MMAGLGAAAMLRRSFRSDRNFLRLIVGCALRASFALALLVHPLDTLAQPAGGAVTGTISDTLGKAVPDAIVALHAAYGHVVATTHSDAHGQFAFHSLPLGPYQLSAAKPQFESATRTIVLD